MNRQFLWLTGAVVAAAVVFAACGGDTGGSAGGGGGTESNAQPVLESTSTDFGSVLVDTQGNTLYMFEPDKSSDSTCYGECAKAWPALTVSGQPAAGTGAEDSLLGTVERKNGDTQVTYNGWPLYTFAFDERPGDINGQGSGGIWWVMSSKGDPVQQPYDVVVTESDEFGQMLTDGQGMSVYMFLPDKAGDSTCYGECAQSWPALTTKADPLVGRGADSSLVGTTERKNGDTQVTYNGWPLYYFAGDKAEGDVNGQSLNDIWWVVSPQGKAIKQKP